MATELLKSGYLQNIIINGLSNYFVINPGVIRGRGEKREKIRYENRFRFVSHSTLSVLL